jgi:hypothetical protein
MPLRKLKTDYDGFVGNASLIEFTHQGKICNLKIWRFSKNEFETRIEIGEGLTAVALSHHLAYGTVPGGSCSRYTQFVMIKEEKQTLLCKETVR